MPEKEATARIKINRLLEDAGWRILPGKGQPANLHYFWDLERGNPHLTTAFPTQASVKGHRQSVAPDLS